MGKADYGLAMRAMFGDLSQCGDYAYVRSDGAYLCVALIDVLGHGPDARKVAEMIVAYLEERDFSNLALLLEGLHRHIFGTRGAVAALCRLDVNTGRLSYSGIGNIVVKIFGGHPLRMVLRDGVVGFGRIKPQVAHVTLHPDDILTLFSDGIREFAGSASCIERSLGTQGTQAAQGIPGTAEEMVSSIMKNCAKESDDASCIVVKYVQDEENAQDSLSRDPRSPGERAAEL